MESFANIGNKIRAAAKQSDVNLIHPFIEVQPGKKLSVIGVYDNSETEIVNGAGEIIPFDKDCYYYGLTPEFGADEICAAIKEGAFKDCESLEKFIDCNRRLFTLPAKMSKYARALFAKTLVKMSVMFGYYFHCGSRECFERFSAIASHTAVKDIDFDISEKEQTVRLLGQPCKEFLNVLDDEFSVGADGDMTIKTDISIKSISESLSEEPLSLTKGKSYYSGVLPRVKKFERRDMNYSNDDVMSIAVIFERSTFATMDAFDGSFIKNHRLLKKYLPLIEEIDETEDSLIKQYLSDMTGLSEIVIEQVNAFLAQSYSAHNLAVSGNIITSDGYLILAKRGKKTFDANTYYCSINGQSEICDSKVKFYKQSVYEDMPTLHIDNDDRIDFMGELERETDAELNIFCPASHWMLYGISFLAIMNSDCKNADRRRFHFNILGECSSEHSMAQIIQSQKKATEKFENSKLIGVKINQHKNVLTRIAGSLKTAVLWILKSKDLITSIFALAIFAIGFNELKNSEFTIKSLSSIISIIFTILSTLVILKNIIFAVIRYIKRKSTYFKLSILCDCKDFYNDIHCTFAGNNVNLHPIADVMIYEYIKYHLK